MLSRFAFYFDEVARRGSIRQASERLHIASSAIDRQILQMEERLGAKLFDRSPQGLTLTPAGELTADAVRRWRRDLVQLEARINALKTAEDEEVRIAVVEGGLEFLSRRLRTFLQDRPRLRHRIEVASAQAVVDLVLSGRSDLGLTINPSEAAGLRVDPLRSYRLGLAIAPGHPLAIRASVRMSECAAHPLIVPDDSVSLREIIDLAWMRIGGLPRTVSVANSISSIKLLAKAGVGVGLLTALDIEAEIRAGELVFVPLADEFILPSIFAIVSPVQGLTAPALALLDNLVDANQRVDDAQALALSA